MIVGFLQLIQSEQRKIQSTYLLVLYQKVLHRNDESESNLPWQHCLIYN